MRLNWWSLCRHGVEPSVLLARSGPRGDASAEPAVQAATPVRTERHTWHVRRQKQRLPLSDMFRPDPRSAHHEVRPHVLPRLHNSVDRVVQPLPEMQLRHRRPRADIPQLPAERARLEASDAHQADDGTRGYEFPGRRRAPGRQPAPVLGVRVGKPVAARRQRHPRSAHPAEAYSRS